MRPRPPINPKPLNRRLTEQAVELRGQANDMVSPAERDRLIERARQLEAAANMEAWLSSSELKPPS